jgi:hypothetical protein
MRTYLFPYYIILGIIVYLGRRPLKEIILGTVVGAAWHLLTRTTLDIFLIVGWGFVFIFTSWFSESLGKKVKKKWLTDLVSSLLGLGVESFGAIQGLWTYGDAVVLSPQLPVPPGLFFIWPVFVVLHNNFTRGIEKKPDIVTRKVPIALPPPPSFFPASVPPSSIGPSLQPNYLYLARALEIYVGRGIARRLIKTWQEECPDEIEEKAREVLERYAGKPL